jgi:hypothetical protein
MYIMGGHHGQDSLCFDAATEEWSAISPNLKNKRGGGSFVLGGCLYAVGGLHAMSSAERYDVTSDSWTAVADMLDGRYCFGAVTIGSAAPPEEQNLFDFLIAKTSRRRP